MKKLLRKAEFSFAAALVSFGVFAATSSASAQTVSSPKKIDSVVAHNPIHFKHNSGHAKPNAVSGIFNPTDIKKAYGIDQLNRTGKGQTIALVEAYGSPTIVNDLQVFNQQFGLPAANIEVVYPQGKPNTDGGWALETALDVEWAHALAPDAKIMVVSAKSASISDLLVAEDYATSHGATVVSNSWGGSEFSGEASYDSHFNHAGITYLASSGDNGQGSSWPASSPNVVAVGGTTLNVTSNGDYSSESAWSGSGGALSSYETRPAYQSNWTNVVGSKRGIPDVSFDADPNTGVYVYTSTRNQGQQGWFQVGGTSFSAPAWGALIALANEGHSQSLSSSEVLNKVYSLAGTTGSTGYRTNYHDITTGSNGYAAQAGYDVVTGIGSPIANQLVPVLNTK
ncbi:S53 family peptidase [Heyndrickxia camelliae]|uniref:Peptidase S8 and S53 subtilisin kexin sedolisin n=1 Tax=Heyndrickxia camelliae TaxID=1707093 RepID=A0A2N3LLU9_9BACI|nr:S53 family peptidase [Heyndrickxia camelliae]PKR85503.1 peptidase S8 and S53 subtilisin kexin sedolisin [Heyndrickxia camelliae]